MLRSGAVLVQKSVGDVVDERWDQLTPQVQAAIRNLLGLI